MPDDSARPHLFVPKPLATSASRFPPPDRFSQGLTEALGGAIPEAAPAPSDVITSASTPEEAALPDEETEEEEERASDEAPSSSGPSPQEIEKIRADAYQKGYDAGVDEFHKQQRDAESQHQEAFMTALSQIDKMAADLADYESRIEGEASALLLECLTKFYKKLDDAAEERALLLFKAMEDSVDAETAIKQPRGVELYLHPSDAEAFGRIVGEQTATDALSNLKECRVIPSEKIKPGDAEMRWLHGGMAISPKRIFEAVASAFRS